MRKLADRQAAVWSGVMILINMAMPMQWRHTQLIGVESGLLKMDVAFLRHVLQLRLHDRFWRKHEEVNRANVAHFISGVWMKMNFTKT